MAVNITRVIFITLLVLSMFTCAKSFVATHNTFMWWRQTPGLTLQHPPRPHTDEQELTALRQEQTLVRLQGQWMPVRYVSLASIVLSLAGIVVSSRRATNVVSRAEPGAAPNGGPATPVAILESRRGRHR